MTEQTLNQNNDNLPPYRQAKAKAKPSFTGFQALLACLMVVIIVILMMILGVLEDISRDMPSTSYSEDRDRENAIAAISEINRKLGESNSKLSEANTTLDSIDRKTSW